MILLSQPNMTENSLTSSNILLLSYNNIFGFNYYPIGSIFPNYLKNAFLKVGFFEFYSNKFHTLHFLNPINSLTIPLSPPLPFSCRFFVQKPCYLFHRIFLTLGLALLCHLICFVPTVFPIKSSLGIWSQVQFFYFYFLAKVLHSHFWALASVWLLLVHLVSGGLSLREIQIDQGRLHFPAVVSWGIYLGRLALYQSTTNNSKSIQLENQHFFIVCFPSFLFPSLPSSLVSLDR